MLEPIAHEERMLNFETQLLKVFSHRLNADVITSFRIYDSKCLCNFVQQQMRLHYTAPLRTMHNPNEPIWILCILESLNEFFLKNEWKKTTNRNCSSRNSNRNNWNLRDLQPKPTILPIFQFNSIWTTEIINIF